MKVAYLTPFYSGECDGRFGRFNDWVHELREMDDPPFEFEVHSFAARAPDRTLASSPLCLLGDGDELWATKRNNVEHVVNAPRLLADLQSSDADILHPVTVGPVVSPVARAAADGRPIVLGPNVGGWYPLRDGPNWATGGFGQRKLEAKFRLRHRLIDLIGPDRHLAFSRYHRRMLEQVGIAPEKVDVLTAGVDSSFSPESDTSHHSGDPPELLYVGVFSEHKGVDVLLDAVDRLDVDVRLRLVGGTEADLDRTLPDGVTAEGFVPRGDLADIYRRADLFVCPTIDEMGPNTQVEALACGTPVVATDSPGVNEYPPADASALFWPREPRPLADAIERALENLPEMRTAARSHGGGFHADSVINQLAAIYRNLADER